MSSIKCFGVHFSLERVLWDDFEICAWQPRSPNWTYEPDEPELVLNDQSGVYILQDSERRPLYVGRAGSGKQKLGNRLWAHTRNHNRGRWTHFSWFGLNEPTQYGSGDVQAVDQSISVSDDAEINLDASATLAELEAFLITATDPPLNKRGGDWKGTPQLLQWSWADEVSLLELDRQVRKLRRKTKRILKTLEKKSLP